MKLPMTCLTCAITNQIGDQPWLNLVGVREDSRYQTVCPRGHTEVVVLQNPKFDILYEIGANAILDGYYRDAIASFHASLERLYEFFARAVLRKKGVPDQMTETAWKQVHRQSERQLGGFIFLYTMDFLQPPPLLASKRVEFRNEVIHQGRIPSRDEAIDFGQAILDIERQLLIELRQRYSDALSHLTVKKLINARTDEDRGRSVGTMGMATIIGTSVQQSSWHEKPLVQALAELAIRRDLLAQGKPA